MKTECFVALLRRPKFNPLNSECYRVATLGLSDVQIAYGHIQNGVSKKKQNLLCSKDSALTNIEWLKLLKTAYEKNEEMSGAFSACRGNDTKICIQWE